MGYSGGKILNPTYRSIGDHSEAIEIVYDPDIISYSKLLEEFWSGHDATQRKGSLQYRSFIFYKNDSQKEIAEKSFTAARGNSNREIYTEIKEALEFYQAENYHQKYYLQMNDIIKDEFLNIYPVMNDLLSSTAAAKVNGFAGGYGSKENLEKEIDKLGLSPKGNDKLRSLVSGSFW